MLRQAKIILVATLVLLACVLGGKAGLADDKAQSQRVPTQNFLTDPQGYSVAFWEASQIAMDTWNKELGTDFKRQVEEHDQVIRKMFEGDYDCGVLFIMGSPVRLDPGFLFNTFFYASCPGFYNRIPRNQCAGGGGALNFPGYFNPEFNRLLKAQDQIFDYAERKKITDRMAEMIVQDRPVLVLFSPYVVHLMNTKRWQNEKAMPGEGLGSAWNVMGIEPKGDDKVLRVGSTYAVPSINPMAVTRTQGYRVMDLLYDTLFRVDLEGKAVKWMAQEARVTDGPNGRNTAIEINLRPDLKFHDGEQVTADDVLFTVDFARKFKAPDLYNYVKRVVKAEKTGDLSLTLHLSEPWSGVFHVLLSKMYILPEHIWSKVAQEEKEPILWPNPKPVGSGPFKFVSWDKGAQLVMDRNPDYFAPVNPERLVRVKFESMETLAAAVERGEIDLQWGEPMNAAIVERMAGKAQVKAVKLPNHGFAMFTFRCVKAPYNDPVFMEALEYCLPRDLIMKRVYPGLAQTAVSPIPPGNKAWHNPRVFDLAKPFDPKKAREVLKNAGYTWDDQGRLCYPR